MPPERGDASSTPVSAETQRLIGALSALAHDAAQRDPRVREALAAARDWLAALLEESSAGPAPSPPEPPASHGAAPAQPALPLPRQPVTLSIGGTTRTVDLPASPEEVAAASRAIESRSLDQRAAVNGLESSLAPIDLPLVVARCRIKAEGCRWAAERRRLNLIGADLDEDIRPTDVRIIAKAKSFPRCYVWSMDPAKQVPPDDFLQLAAEIYENLALASEVSMAVFAAADQLRSARSEAYGLMAEAQSAARIVLLDVDVRRDSDQDDAFRWLRERTFEDQVHVPQFMRLDDPADPLQWPALRERIQSLRERVDERLRRQSSHRGLMNKAAYHVRRIEQSKAGDDIVHDWNTLARAVDELVTLGLAPSNADLRALLIPIIDQIPEGLPSLPGLERVLEEVDRFLSAQELDSLIEPSRAARSPALVEAAELLRGGVVVLIGGQRRPQAATALTRALELAELRWITAGRHESLYRFEPAIARPETRLVLLAIRWSSHSFEGVREFCNRHGKPLVRLPGGYSPNQVAEQIIRQVSSQLQPAR